MIKIKTKRIDENEFTYSIGVDYKAKGESMAEILVVINHLLQELKQYDITKGEILELIESYLDKEEE